MTHGNDGDKDVNQITLLYMSSYGGQSSKEEDASKTIMFSNEDRRFYKKRILEVVKDILRGGKVPEAMKDSCDHFMASTVRYLKEVDRRDILQAAYRDITDLPPILEDDEETRSVEEANELIMHKARTDPKSTLDDFVERKGGRQNDPSVPPPQKKIVNLSDPQLRTKGVEGLSKVKKGRRKGH